MYALALFTIVITCKLTVRANHSWVVNQHLCVLNLESEGILDYFTCLIRLYWTKNKMTNDFNFVFFLLKLWHNLLTIFGFGFDQLCDHSYFLFGWVWLRQNVHYYCIDKWLFNVFSSDVGGSCISCAIPCISCSIVLMLLEISLNVNIQFFDLENKIVVFKAIYLPFSQSVVMNINS